MSKTIEEAAKRFADRECEIGQVDWDALYKGYYHGMKDLFSQPLASRMTEAEKERVIRIYKELKSLCAEHKDSVFRWTEVYTGQYKLLETIFGSDFFKEAE